MSSPSLSPRMSHKLAPAQGVLYVTVTYVHKWFVAYRWGLSWVVRQEKSSKLPQAIK